MGSADWMNRNLHSRIEVVFPVYDAQLARQLDDILKIQLSDTRKAVLLDADLNNNRLIPDPGETPVAAQESIYRYVAHLKEEPAEALTAG
jgi:polyphosphate kinase